MYVTLSTISASSTRKAMTLTSLSEKTKAAGKCLTFKVKFVRN